MDLTDNKEVALLFSGGRDSSLAACIFALRGYKVHLLSFYSGFGIKSDLSNYRYEEIKNRFPDNVIGRIIIPTFGLVRRIAILKIENDFAKYKVNLILMGEKMAMHAAATVYCLQHNIRIIADGTSGYQQQMPEQMPTAVNLLRAFHSEDEIDYMTPIIDFKSEDEVKYMLFELGISTKSLEGMTIFSESFSTPAVEVLGAYIREKMPICREYVNLILHCDFDHLIAGRHVINS